MGFDWWIRKLRKYENVRSKVTGSRAMTATLSQLELDRFKDDENRRLRTAKRAKMIEQEPSLMKRTILEAKQFADTFSGL